MKAIDPARRKRIVFYVLLVACIGIWGYVLYQVIEGLRQADDSLGIAHPVMASPSSPATPVSQPAAPYSYQDDFRDPFTPPTALFPAPAPRRSRVVPRPEPTRPPLALAGVVDDTALLQGEDGSTYVVRAGEHAAGTRVLRVTPDRVVLRYEGRSVTLRLHQ